MFKTLWGIMTGLLIVPSFINTGTATTVHATKITTNPNYANSSKIYDPTEDNWVDHYANILDGISIKTTKNLNAVPYGTPFNKKALFNMGEVTDKNGNKFTWPFWSFITGVDFHYQMPQVDNQHNKVIGDITVSKHNEQSKIVHFTVQRIKTDADTLNDMVSAFSNLKIYFNADFNSYVSALDTWEPLTSTKLSNIGTVWKDGHIFNWPTDLEGAKISYKYDAYKADSPIDQFTNGQIQITVGSFSKTLDFQMGNHNNYIKDIRQKPYSVHVDYTFSFLLDLDEENALLGFNGTNPIFISAYSLFSYLTGSTSDGAKTHAPFASQLWHDATYGGLESQQFLKQTIYDKIDDSVKDTVKIRASFGGSTKIILKFSTDTHSHSDPKDPTWQTISNESLKAV